MDLIFLFQGAAASNKLVFNNQILNSCIAARRIHSNKSPVTMMVFIWSASDATSRVSRFTRDPASYYAMPTNIGKMHHVTTKTRDVALPRDVASTRDADQMKTIIVEAWVPSQVSKKKPALSWGVLILILIPPLDCCCLVFSLETVFLGLCFLW